MELAKAQKLADELMTLHGLHYPKWSFKFDHAKRRFGVCKYNRLGGQIFRGEISLSKHLVLLNDEEKVKDTILHEIAHALTPGHGHDVVWKRKCIEIGAKPERCYSSKEVNTIPLSQFKYLATCGGCGKEFGLHKMTAKRQRTQSACRCQAGKPWSERILLTFIDTKAA